MRTLVICPWHREYLDECRRLDLHPQRDAVYVSRRDQVLGLRKEDWDYWLGSRLWLVDGYTEIMDVIHRYGIEPHHRPKGEA